MIKVILADDHKMFIDGLRAFLKTEEDISIVGEASNGEEIIAILEKTSVDIVVMDLDMPGTGGIETARYIQIHHPEVKVLVLSMHNRRDYTLELIQTGISGYILKDRSKEDLLTAIRQVFHTKQAYYSIDVSNRLWERKKGSESPVKILLSQREKEVLCLTAQGETAKAIAEKLNIAPTTVNTHRRNLNSKIGVRNDKQLVAYAIRNNICDQEAQG